MCVCVCARTRVPGRLHSRIWQLVHVCVRTRARISLFVRACLGDCIVGFGSWFMCVCVRACMPGRLYSWIRQLVRVCARAWETA